MIKSNLIDLLRKLSTEELKEFGEYVRSPFFNKNQSTIKLLDYIRKYAPDFNDKKLGKELVYQKLFPGMKYNDGFTRTIMFNLAKLTEDYLTYTRIRNTGYAEKLSLLTDYNKRELNRMFEKTISVINNELLKTPLKDHNYYYAQYRVEDENLIYLQRIHYEKPEKFIESSGIENILNNLTYFYLIRILKYYVVILNTRAIYRIEFKTELIEDIISNFRPELYQDIPLIRIYYYMIMMHEKEDDESYFTKLKNTLPDIRNQIAHDDLLEALINLENYSMRKIRKGRNDFNIQLSDIYKMELRLMGYSKNTAIPHQLFRAVVVNSLAICDFEWVMNFMETYKGFLNEEVRENTSSYCLALYYFATRKFEEALKISTKIKYEDVYQKFELKSLIAALYYELDMEEQLLALLDSFRHLVSSDTLIPDFRKINYIKFIKYIKKLIKIKYEPNCEEFEELMFHLKKENGLFHEDWLLIKLKEIGKKKNLL